VKIASDAGRHYHAMILASPSKDQALLRGCRRRDDA
jgi:hypothetical protein